ncbi:uncharacterized protein LOC124278150 [Haliotis rubra]|uniref:uncharacterized protein LOC124278150 n=1 Tax=Haliotis rubra TaxID=36100 RepID=UPI001EE526EB|nr:uncharacterized protein LOC124278150 [Haliotis rubra]
MTTRETFDDVFDDEAADEPIQRREWSKVETDLKKGGYREGVKSGQESTLQSGFNAGYNQAVSICLKMGHLRGKLSAHLSWRSRDATSPESEKKHGEIEFLLKEISQFEKELVKTAKQNTSLVEETTPAKPFCSSDSSNITGQDAGDDKHKGSDSPCVCGNDKRCPQSVNTMPEASCEEKKSDQRETTLLWSGSGVLSSENPIPVYKNSCEGVNTEANVKYEHFFREANTLINE